jgi:hypothetical protein
MKKIIVPMTVFLVSISSSLGADRTVQGIPLAVDVEQMQIANNRRADEAAKLLHKEELERERLCLSVTLSQSLKFPVVYEWGWSSSEPVRNILKKELEEKGYLVTEMTYDRDWERRWKIDKLKGTGLGYPSVYCDSKGTDK